LDTILKRIVILSYFVHLFSRCIAPTLSRVTWVLLRLLVCSGCDRLS